LTGQGHHPFTCPSTCCHVPTELEKGAGSRLTIHTDQLGWEGNTTKRGTPQASSFPQHMGLISVVSVVQSSAIANALSGRFPIKAAWDRLQVVLCAICDGQSGSGAVFYKYFGFPCHFSSRQMLRTHLSSGAGTVGPVVADSVI
jgi:hypothetical protein